MDNLESSIICLTCPHCGRNVETEIHVTVTRLVQPSPVRTDKELPWGKTQLLSKEEVLGMIDDLVKDISTVKVIEGLAPSVIRTGMEIEVKIPEWLRKEKSLLSAHLVGEAKQVTGKAILFKGRVKVGYSQSCLRCGREITNPVSRVVGYGPYCSQELGLPREMSNEQAQEWLEKLSASEEKELWLPLSRIEITERNLENDR